MQGKPAAGVRALPMRYTFRLAGGRTAEITVTLDARTLGLRQPDLPEYPPWTALQFEQCSNCPLRPEEHPRCPAAVSVMEAIEHFGDIISHEEADVSIETPARTYRKRTSMQDAVSSLLGLTMASSGCPILAKLRPMVRHHLPFSTVEETHYRVLSMYLLAQYFRSQNGEEPDWDLSELKDLYEEIRVVNESFARRLKGLRIQDTSANALSILDAFALMVSVSIDRHRLDDLERLFAPYLGGSARGDDT